MHSKNDVVANPPGEVELCLIKQNSDVEPRHASVTRSDGKHRGSVGISTLLSDTTVLNKNRTTCMWRISAAMMASTHIALIVSLVVRRPGSPDLLNESYIAGMLSCVWFLLLGMPSVNGEAPTFKLRRFYAIFVISCSAFALVLPWLRFADEGLTACRRRLEIRFPSATDSVWYERVMRFDLVMTCVFSLPTSLCLYVHHPSSRYIRGGVQTIVAVWILHLNWNIKGLALCEGIGWLRGYTYGFGTTMAAAIQYLTQLLIYHKIQSMAAELERPLYSKAILKTLAATFALRVLDFRTTRILQLPRRYYSFLGILTIGFCFLFCVFTVASYWIPLNMLKQQMKFLEGIPLAEARWAARTIRRELILSFLCNSLALVNTISAHHIHKCRSGRHPHYIWSRWKDVFITASLPLYFDSFANIACIVVFSGLFLQDRMLPTAPQLPETQSNTSFSMADRRKKSSTWEATVSELGHRGFVLEDLLDFSARLGQDVMLGFNPMQSTTEDVVWQAVIPCSVTQENGKALSTVWNNDLPVLAETMVTHHWKNLFLHLVAAIVADALGRDHYSDIVYVLATGQYPLLKEQLRRCGGLHRVYWVCAFCINQHSCICGSLCMCSTPKYFNDTPDPCEVNKFDDMMLYLKQEFPSRFRQVIAVDLHFDLFTRAWCVAELFEAHAGMVPQRIIIHSVDELESRLDTLATLDVRLCEATKEEDKIRILSKIEDFDSFNSSVQSLIFGANGLFNSWIDGQRRIANSGRIAARAIRRASHCKSHLTGRSNFKFLD